MLQAEASVNPNPPPHTTRDLGKEPILDLGLSSHRIHDGLTWTIRYLHLHRYGHGGWKCVVTRNPMAAATREEWWRPSEQHGLPSKPQFDMDLQVTVTRSKQIHEISESASERDRHLARGSSRTAMPFGRETRFAEDHSNTHLIRNVHGPRPESRLMSSVGI